MMYVKFNVYFNLIIFIFKETYELEVRMFDNNAGSHHQEIVCMRAQLRMKVQ
jgi:hypothetical protein